MSEIEKQNKKAEKYITEKQEDLQIGKRKSETDKREV